MPDLPLQRQPVLRQVARFKKEGCQHPHETYGAVLAEQVGAHYTTSGATVTSEDIADALCCRASTERVMAVTQWVCHQREFTEAHARRTQEVVFREKLQLDLEQHASFTHKIVTGNAAAVQLPTDDIREIETHARQWGRCGDEANKLTSMQ